MDSVAEIVAKVTRETATDNEIKAPLLTTPGYFAIWARRPADGVVDGATAPATVGRAAAPCGS